MILNDFQQIQKFTFVASAKSAELGRKIVKKQHVIYFLQATVLGFFFTGKTVKRNAIIVLHFFFHAKR